MPHQSNIDDVVSRMIRVGNITCEQCGKTADQHPKYYGHLVNDGTGRMIPWLRIGCDGKLWKL
jgi:hypothetical protein